VLARDIYRGLYEESGPTVGDQFALAGKRLGVALACGAVGLGVLDFAGVHSIAGVHAAMQSARSAMTGHYALVQLDTGKPFADAASVVIPIPRSEPKKAGPSPIDTIAAEGSKDAFAVAMNSSTLKTSSSAASARASVTSATPVAPSNSAGTTAAVPLASIKAEPVGPQMSAGLQLSEIAARSQASVPPDIQLASLPTQDVPREPLASDSVAIVAAAMPIIPLNEVPLPRAAPPMSPADRLGLKGKDYTRAERCLANAIYFEARSEPIRGQMAVAQVVVNRTFSGFYPNDICGVVYQNASRHLACQFTFACDGKSKAITERSHWAVANRIARQTLDGQIYVPEVGKSTHYHAAYVHPNWMHEMHKLARFGLHSFYRPYAWGNGKEEPVWGPSPTFASVHKTASR
jgi:hypothetical protein